MDVADVIKLLSDPPKLLRQCMLVIAGGSGAAPANGQAGTATFQVSMKDHVNATGFTTGLSGMAGLTKSRAVAKLLKLHGAARTSPAADEFNAYYIPMVQTADALGGASHYSLPTAGGPDVMITSKLSGCTFGVGSSATGATLVSHIQPDLSLAAGPARATDLDTAVTGGFNAMTGQFRKGTEYTDYASVIGRRSGGVWKFFLQAQDAAPNYSHVISKVDVI